MVIKIKVLKRIFYRGTVFVLLPKKIIHMRTKLFFFIFLLVIATSLSAFTLELLQQKEKNKGKTTIATVKKTDKFIKETKVDSTITH